MTYTASRTTYSFWILIALTVLFFSFTTSAHAYFTTAQKEIRLSDGSGLFLIEYSFGMAKYEVYMTPFAQRSLTTDTKMVSYEILNEKNEVVAGKAVGIVLSDTMLNKDIQYVVSKNASKKFTLAVFFTPDKKNTGEKYRLHVTYLPFKFDGTQQLQLNPSELEKYTTKGIAL